MFIQTAFCFSSAVQRLVCRFSGLRLLALCRFQAFLASIPCAASASSYSFCSTVLPRWRCAFSQFVPVAKSKLSVLASGSNISVKPTRILRSAYLARYPFWLPALTAQSSFLKALRCHSGLSWPSECPTADPRVITDNHRPGFWISPLE